MRSIWILCLLLAVPVGVVAAPGAAEPDLGSCPPGMVRGVDTHGWCCWPGQAWNGDRCVGRPTSCPAGFEVGSNECVEVFAACADGQVVMPDQVHCCWPGQSFASGRCAGAATSCPASRVLVAGDCRPVPVCTEGRQLTFDRAGCCWPGQAWSETRHACLGEPESCPPQMKKDGENCVARPPLTSGRAGDWCVGAKDACNTDSLRKQHPKWHFHTFVTDGARCYECYDEESNDCEIGFLASHPGWAKAGLGKCMALGMAPAEDGVRLHVPEGRPTP